MHWLLTFLPLLIAAALLYGAFRFVTSRRDGTLAYNAGTALALLAVLLLFWVNGAVGIIGSSDNDANLMYGGVVLIAFGGATAADFHPRGMMLSMLAAAGATVTIALIALVLDLGIEGAAWPRDLAMATVFFTAMWLASAALFRRAARASGHPPA